jgi:hypothetical protein
MPSVASVSLKGTEVRCRAKVVKNYAGLKKLKTCNALLSVVTLDINGGSGSVTVHSKCTKANCGNMVHHVIDC